MAAELIIAPEAQQDVDEADSGLSTRSVSTIQAKPMASKLTV